MDRPQQLDRATTLEILGLTAFFSQAELLVWLAHNAEANPGGESRTTARRLAELTGLDDRGTIPKVLASLQAKGGLKMTDQTSKPRAYAVCLPHGYAKKAEPHGEQRLGKPRAPQKEGTLPPFGGTIRRFDARSENTCSVNYEEHYASDKEPCTAPTISDSSGALPGEVSGRGEARARAHAREGRQPPPTATAPNPHQIKQRREAEAAQTAMLAACPVDDLDQLKDTARRYRLRVIRENIDRERKRAAEMRQPLTWYRLRSAIRGDYAGKERRARAVQKVKKAQGNTTEEAEAIVMMREQWTNAAIDAADTMSDEQVLAVLMEAAGALPTEELRADAVARIRKLADNGLSARAIATNAIFARLFTERATLIEQGGARYVRDADEPENPKE